MGQTDGLCQSCFGINVVLGPFIGEIRFPVCACAQRSRHFYACVLFQNPSADG